MRNPILTACLALFIAGCVSFTGGGTISPLFSANFRSGSSFPNLEPMDNVLLIDVSTSVDRLPPQTLKLFIDGTQVHSQSVSSSGRIELNFPPPAWTPSVGEHELEIEMGDVSRTLPFTWND